jgi:hypothetical protein
MEGIEAARCRFYGKADLKGTVPAKEKINKKAPFTFLVLSTKQ